MKNICQTLLTCPKGVLYVVRYIMTNPCPQWWLGIHEIYLGWLYPRFSWAEPAPVSWGQLVWLVDTEICSCVWGKDSNQRVCVRGTDPISDAVSWMCLKVFEPTLDEKCALITDQHAANSQWKRVDGTRELASEDEDDRRQQKYQNKDVCRCHTTNVDSATTWATPAFFPS